jgi:hypothetical protein
VFRLPVPDSVMSGLLVDYQQSITAFAHMIWAISNRSVETVVTLPPFTEPHA